ncbi:MAG: hypothetical protein AAGF99_06435 [Bacteroidota bacterium]
MRRFAVLVVLMTSSVALAQPAEDPVDFSTPESVALALSNAYRDSDFDRAAQLMHPTALADLHDFVTELAALDPDAAAMFGGEMSADSLAAATPEQAFAAFMQAVFTMPGMQDALGSLDTDVIGHVVEADSVAHVVTRAYINTMGIEMTRMQVVSLQRAGSEWKALLTGDIPGITAAFRANMGLGDE